MMTEERPTDAPVARSERPLRRWPLGVGRTIVLIAALCFLTGAIVWSIDQPERQSFNATDVGFLADMTAHHQGAIGMSFAYLRRENDSLVGHFAREIVLTQSQEISTMNALLDQAGNPNSATDDIAMDWMGMAVPLAQMPGMPTAAEMDQLRGSTGAAADDQFTNLMIQHHAAGAAMADHAAEHGENSQVRRLAAAMARVQRTEINEINTRRIELGLERVVPAPITAH